MTVSDIQPELRVRTQTRPPGSRPRPHPLGRPECPDLDIRGATLGWPPEPGQSTTQIPVDHAALDLPFVEDPPEPLTHVGEDRYTEGDVPDGHVAELIGAVQANPIMSRPIPTPLDALHDAWPERAEVRDSRLLQLASALLGVGQAISLIPGAVLNHVLFGSKIRTLLTWIAFWLIMIGLAIAGS